MEIHWNIPVISGCLYLWLFIFFFSLAMDFIVWIFAIIILYTNVNFLQNSVFHIARSLHSSFYVTFPSRTVCLKVCCCCSFAKLCTALRCHRLAHKAHLSMRFSRQEYWSGLPFPSPQHSLLQMIKLLFHHRESCISRKKKCISGIA